MTLTTILPEPDASGFVVASKIGMRMVNRLSRKIVEAIKPTVCDCSSCRNLCKTSPCLGTPDEMARIAKAGYADKLVVSHDLAYVSWGFPMVTIIAPRMEESGCVFLDELGHCTLHDKGLKPVEGRLAHCGNTTTQCAAIHFEVLKSWASLQ